MRYVSCCGDNNTALKLSENKVYRRSLNEMMMIFEKNFLSNVQ